MPVFNFNYDVKVSVWQRDNLAVEAENLEEAIEKLKADSINDYEEYFVESETLYETQERFDDTKYPTAELILVEKDVDTIIYDNINGWLD